MGGFDVNRRGSIGAGRNCWVEETFWWLVGCWLMRMDPLFAWGSFFEGGEADDVMRNFNGGILGRFASSMRL